MCSTISRLSWNKSIHYCDAGRRLAIEISQCSLFCKSVHVTNWQTLYADGTIKELNKLHKLICWYQMPTMQDWRLKPFQHHDCYCTTQALISAHGMYSDLLTILRTNSDYDQTEVFIVAALFKRGHHLTHKGCESLNPYIRDYERNCSWDVTPYNLVDKCRYFGQTAASIFKAQKPRR